MTQRKQFREAFRLSKQSSAQIRQDQAIQAQYKQTNANTIKTTLHECYNMRRALNQKLRLIYASAPLFESFYKNRSTNNCTNQYNQAGKYGL